MKKYKERSIRFCTVLLSLLLCITFMPAGAFADDGADVQGAEAANAQLLETPADGEAATAAEGGAEPANLNASAQCTHDELRKIEETKASCSAVGTKAHYICQSCGKKFLDALCKQEVTDDSQLVIPVDPSAHKFG